MPIGCQEWETLRTVSSRLKVIWRPYYACCDRVQSSPARSVRCGKCHLETWERVKYFQFSFTAYSAMRMPTYMQTHLIVRRARGGVPIFLVSFSPTLASVSFEPSRSAQQVVARTQSSTQRHARREDLIGLVGQRVHVRHRAPPPVDLGDSAGPLQLFRPTLGNALRPHAARRPRATALSCASKSTSWQRAV